MLWALLTQLLRSNKAQWCELGTGCYSPSPGSFLPCLVSSQSPNFHKSLCWFLALSFPQSWSQSFIPMCFLLALVKSLCLPQHPLSCRVNVVMVVSRQPLAEGGEEEVQQEMGKAKQSHHQHTTLKGRGGTLLGFCWFYFST